MTHVPCSPCTFTAGLHEGSGTNPVQTLDPRVAFTIPPPCVWLQDASVLPHFTDGKVEAQRSVISGSGI